MTALSRISLFVLLAVLMMACVPDDEAATNSSLPPAAQNQQQQPASNPTSTPIPTAPAISRPTYLVQRGDVQEILKFTGRWQPRDQAQLSFEIAGTIRRVEVQRGATVNAGDLLADYQINELEGQLATALLDLENAESALQTGAQGETTSIVDAEIAVANARLSLENTKANSPWAGSVSARQGLEDAERNLNNAQRAYDDARSRPEQGPSAAEGAYQSLLSAQSALLSAQLSYDQAGQAWANHLFSVKQQENALLQAEMQLERVRSGGADPAGQQQVRAAQLRIDQLNEDIARSSLVSPIDGEVLEVNIKPGDSVQPFTSVIVVGRPEPREAIANLAIGDAQRLSVGLVGTCQIMNDPDSKVQCIVRQIPLSARDADQTTRVAASLDNVTTNQLIEIEMPLQVRENVLWLPPAAIRTFQNRTFVVLETPDGPRSVDVQIGLRTNERVEIVNGVSEGDVVQGP